MNAHVAAQLKAARSQQGPKAAPSRTQALRRRWKRGNKRGNKTHVSLKTIWLSPIYSANCIMLTPKQLATIRADWTPYADGASPASVAVNALLAHADAQAAAHRKALAGLLQEFYSGNEPLLSDEGGLERVKMEVKGRNIERGKMKAWVRLRAHELGLRWPLPAAEAALAASEARAEGFRQMLIQAAGPATCKCGCNPCECDE